MGDKPILKAETEDGYGRVANLLLESLAISKLNGKQMSICLFIIRKTYSWGKKSDEITLKQFAAACDSSDTYMSKQLKQLIEWKVIKRNNYSPGKTPDYEINTRVDEWDKGCLNVQGLNENTRQGLYNTTRVDLNERTRVPLNERTTLVQGQTVETTGVEGCLKESSKESTTTTVIIESAKVEIDKREKDPVANTDTDSIQQDNLDKNKEHIDLLNIEDYYKREIRKRVTCSGKDLGDIAFIYNKYDKDMEFIISVMEKAKEDYINRYGKLEINSFSYFFSIFEERWNLLHEKKENVKVDTSDKRPYVRKNNKSKPKQTRFHNFEQRSDKYTDEQLEDVVARKRREYAEKIKNKEII